MGVPVPLPSKDGAASRRGPRAKRVQLDSMDRVRRELARIYVAARDGELDTQDFSRLANGLSLGGRIDGELASTAAAYDVRGEIKWRW